MKYILLLLGLSSCIKQYECYQISQGDGSKGDTLHVWFKYTQRGVDKITDSTQYYCDETDHFTRKKTKINNNFTY